MEEAASLIVAEQKRLAPIRTGALRDSITWTFGSAPAGSSFGGGQRSANETRITITEGNMRVRYAPFVEFGTTSMQAQPHFYPGYRATRRRARTIIAANVRKAVKAAV
jgi:HK97 gp10 family phage protein